MAEPRVTPLRGSAGWLLPLAAALLLALTAQWLLVKPYRIPSESMLPTLKVGERVLVDRLSGRFGAPQLGDVVVFHPPAGADGALPSEMCAEPRMPHAPCLRPRSEASRLTYIKRVVGMPGDTLAVRGGRVIRNGRPLVEQYALPCHGEPCELADFRVPAGSYFMMGDNRGHSSDSRFWGPVPRDQVIGRAFATYWPVRSIGGL